MDICVLSVEEAGRLEHWAIWPQCKGHRHMKRSEAIAGVQNGEFRFVGGEGTKITRPVTMIVPCRVSPWRPVQAHDETGRRIIGFKVWGVAPAR